MAESLDKILVVQWLIQHVVNLLFEARVAVTREVGEPLDQIGVFQWLIQLVVSLLFEALVAVSRRQLVGQSLDQIVFV